MTDDVVTAAHRDNRQVLASDLFFP